MKNQTKKYKNSSKNKERATKDTHRNGGTIPKKRNQNIKVTGMLKLLMQEVLLHLLQLVTTTTFLDKLQ